MRKYFFDFPLSCYSNLVSLTETNWVMFSSNTNQVFSCILFYFLIEFSLSIRSIFAVCFACCNLCINYSAGAATYFFVITFSLCYMVFSPVIFVFLFIYKYFHKNKTVSCHPIEYGDSWRPVTTLEISMRHSIGL